MTDQRNAIPASDRIRPGEWVMLTGLVESLSERTVPTSPISFLLGLPEGLSAQDHALLHSLNQPLKVISVDWPYVTLSGKTWVPGGVPTDFRKWKWKIAPDGLVAATYFVPSLWVCLRDAFKVWANQRRYK